MIRVGVIGYGRWGPNLARCIAADAECRLFAVCDVLSDRLTVAASAHAEAILAPDWHMVVADPRIDAIAIATPANCHFEIARAALHSGKHVLVEMPIAQSAQAAHALVAVAASKKLVLMTDHTYSYSPAVRTVHELVKSNALGMIRRFDSVRTNSTTPIRDVDVLWDLAIHDLSIIDFIFEPPQALSAEGFDLDSAAMPSRAAISLYFADDMRARIQVDWSAAAKVRRIEIAGSKEKLIFDDMRPDGKVRVLANGGHAGMNGAAVIPFGEREPLRIMIRDFASCIRSRRKPLSDGTAGLRVVRLLEAAQQSIAERGRIVQIGGQRSRDLVQH